MFYYDPTYFLVMLGALLSMIASMNVQSTFRRFAREGNHRGLTGRDVAERILHSSGIYDVEIERVRGNLTDHYSPGEKVLRLSDSVYGSTSVAALGVAAHECGHALQHQENYGPLALRSASVPLANFGSMLSWPIMILGIILGYMNLAQIGVLLFLVVVFFQLITLPVEFNASRRALVILNDDRILDDEEMYGARKVLKAAALTYVAALFTSILQLLRMLLILQGGSRRRD